MRSLPPVCQWLVLILLSAGLGLIFLHYHIPAALLLGPMVVAITMSLLGSTIQVSMPFFIAAQAVLGCMIAQSLSADILIPLKTNWPMILFVLLMTLFASGVSGWLLVRFSSLPGSTGAWGTAPGGASAMVAMSADFGADMRLVAFMQYLRVLFVVAAAAIVAHAMSDGQALAAARERIWFPPLSYWFLVTVAIGLAGALIGKRFAIPSGAMLLPMFFGAGLQGMDWVTLELPEWLLASAYATIGLSVGLRFNLSVLRLAFKALPQIMASIFSLMLMCALLAFMLHEILGTDLLTAYLATSPGGLDTVAIIAAGTGSDLSLIISIQTLRLVTVLFTGPAMAKFLSRWAQKA